MVEQTTFKTANGTKLRLHTDYENCTDGRVYHGGLHVNFDTVEFDDGPIAGEHTVWFYYKDAIVSHVAVPSEDVAEIRDVLSSARETYLDNE